MSSDAEKISGLFQNFERSAFRLEMQQTYTIPSEQDRLKAFLAGGSQPQRDLRWHGNVAAKIAEGKTMPRSKVVRRPLSDYTRFLFAWSVPENIRAGEEYRIVDLTDRHLELPSRDFWLFDDKVLLLLNFQG
ncbi:MAG: hypothetical protein JWQ81_1210 [Amycolatopsis sp.]|uniref:DUF6879 family protein n=1 Tax=Amycolatopsis sp. TaxID=37632 RepID=UPI0026381703|nr:DUF6879 family protein [Amycolatopsis sp.]MCU1680471.1 hypothetical protein [Amycolatopsis sp.]